MHYQDTFWSSDYQTGIKSLLLVLEKGLNEGKASLTYFQDYTEIIELEGLKFSQLSFRQQQYLGSDQTSKEVDQKGNRTLEMFFGEGQFPTIDGLNKSHAEFGKQISISNEKVTSKIESEIVIGLTDFLDDYKGFTEDLKRELFNQLNNYTKSVQSATSSKEKFESKRRELDDTISSGNQLSAEGSLSRPITSQDLPDIENEETLPRVSPDDDIKAQLKDDQEGSEDFLFPLIIGGIKFETVDELRDILNDLLEEIPIKRRMIPIPGINNEYFQSQDFAKWVRSRFPKNDTRNQIEHFGQDMINLGLMRNWNKLSHNLFTSDSGYYEFTDLGRYTARFRDTHAKEEIISSAPPKPLITITSPTTNDVWNGLKSRFVTHKDRTILLDELKGLEAKYLQSVIDVLESKTLLESSILSFTKKAEIFDSNRINLLFKLHSHFDSIITQHTTQNLKSFKSLSNQAPFNDRVLKYSLLKNITESESGWYWPKLDTRVLNHFSASKVGNIFDTDLVNQIINGSIEENTLKSVPVFFYKVLDKLWKEDLKENWTINTDIIRAANVKKLILQNNLQNSKNTQNSENKGIHDAIECLFENFNTEDIVNFMKVWLVELPDSLIPFSTYDSLLQAYETNDTIDMKLHILGSIPRQNLATLLYLICYLSKLFSNHRDLLDAEVNIPFIHLIMRPPPKRLHTNISDAPRLRLLVDDLFNQHFQKSLYQKLESMEGYHIQKIKRTEGSLVRLKEVRKESPKAISHRKADSFQENLTVDGLRQFKTTPNPSPKNTPFSSPARSRSNSNLNPRTGNLLSESVIVRPSETYKREIRGTQTEHIVE